MAKKETSPGVDETVQSWHSDGFDLPAPEAHVTKYIGKQDGPVALGVLRQLAAADDNQFESDEVWADISGINADALKEGGYEGEIADLVKPDPRPQPRTELNGALYERHG